MKQNSLKLEETRWIFGMFNCYNENNKINKKIFGYFFDKLSKERGKILIGWKF